MKMPALLGFPKAIAPLAIVLIFMAPELVRAGNDTGALQKLSIVTGRSPDHSFTLSGPESYQQVIVMGLFSGGTVRDLTRSVQFEVSPGGIVAIDDAGLVTPLKDGQATIQVRVSGGSSAGVKVTVKDLGQPAPVSFENHVVPIFTKFGCNGGGCHGKTGGQNGFALSLFGFEPDEDYEFLVKEGRGRRLLPSAPGHSLLLKKATGSVAHGGGRRLPQESLYYHLIRRWIEQGMPSPTFHGGRPDGSVVTHIEVLPRQLTLSREGQQQLAVIAHLGDGSTMDVTRLTRCDSNDPELAEVTDNGLVTVKKRPGSFAVMTRYQTHVDVFQALVPLGEKVANLPASKNFIDQQVFKRWQVLGLPPSSLCDDATFLRRATIDIAGRLPTLEETKVFLADKDANRHEKLVDRLLTTPDYAYYFASKWSAVLRNRRKSDKDDPRATFAFHAWIKDSLLQNKPFDQFVREVVAVTGKQPEQPPVVWYREVNRINDQVEDVAQLFLGQRITCARCHHHPFEKWSQQDYWGMAAFFSRVEFKDPPPMKVKTKDKNAPPPRAPMEVLHKPGLAQAVNPRTGKPVKPAGLGSKELSLPAEVDPRGNLVDWMTAPDNPYFARALANRYWKHFFGRGLVEPEDDLRLTNPPTDPELLDALAKYFTEQKYDLKKLVRAICTSHVYRLSGEPNEFNEDDRQNFTRFQPRKLTAEVLLDAIDDLTLMRTSFKSVPAGTRAVQLPDNQVDSYFLSVFGRPDFASACECERLGDANLAQSLTLVNSSDLMNKIAKGRAAKMVKDNRPHAEKIREIYLIAFSREPEDAEIQVFQKFLDRPNTNPQRAYEDILWSVLNTKEFLFNH